jgi:hypothetical protein
MSLLWKGLTGVFYDRILFGEVYKNDDDLVKKFNINKFPTIIMYKVHDRSRLVDVPEIIKYEGLIQADKLIEWIQPHSLLDKRYNLQNRGINDMSHKEIAENLDLRSIDMSDYEDFLNKFSNKNILIYFHTKYIVKDYIKDIMVHTHPFFISAFFNCDKHRQFCLEKFGVTVFPMLKLIKSGQNLQERLHDILTFNISKSNKVPLEDQIRNVFPSRVQNFTTLEFPYRLNEAKNDQKYLMLNFYIGDETKNPLSFDLLSSLPEVNSHFSFITVKDPSSEIIKFNNLAGPSGIFILHLIKDNYKSHSSNRESPYSSLYGIADNLIWFNK